MPPYPSDLLFNVNVSTIPSPNTLTKPLCPQHSVQIFVVFVIPLTEKSPCLSPLLPYILVLCLTFFYLLSNVFFFLRKDWLTNKGWSAVIILLPFSSDVTNPYVSTLLGSWSETELVWKIIIIILNARKRLKFLKLVFFPMSGRRKVSREENINIQEEREIKVELSANPNITISWFWTCTESCIDKIQ